MPIERLDHVQLAMPAGGEDAARRFYDETLGIPEVQKPAHLAKRGGCWFENGSVKIHLGVEQDFRPARKAHPALVVSDLSALIECLWTRDIAWSRTKPSRAMIVAMSMIHSATASS